MMYNNPEHTKMHNHLLMSIRNSRRIINLSGRQLCLLFLQFYGQYQGTKYTIVRQVATSEMNYQLANQCYTILWTDFPLTIKEIRNEPDHVKINHFADITQLTRKNKMAANLNAMRVFFPKDYNFYPETWVMPIDFHKIIKKHTKGKVYIVKPDNGCQGKGIYLLDNPSKIQKQSTEVVQEYILNPMLLNGLKFDLRIYVLITCLKPLRVYIYKEGLARFATEKFEKPNQQNLTNSFSHLTNYAINKLNETFVIDEVNPNNSHKRLLSTVFPQNAYREQLLNEISKIVIKSIISSLPMIQNSHNQCQSKRSCDPSSNFQLLGYDIILNEKEQPILLEVNQNPSLVTDTNIDYQLKHALVQDIFNIIGNNSSNLHCDEKYEQQVMKKDKHQMAHKGQFERIYPNHCLEATQYYDQFIIKSQNLYKDKFGINIVRNVKKNIKEQHQSFLLWNQNPQFYSKAKVQKVYGNRLAKTSQFKKRLVNL